MFKRKLSSRAPAIVSALLAVAAASLSPALPAAARTEPQVVPGLGKWIDNGTDFVGFYNASAGGTWTKVYCVRPGAGEPATITLRTMGTLPGASQAVTRQLAETLAAHGDAQTAVQAAAVSQALNEEIGNHAAVVRRAASLPDRVQAIADRYVAEARATAGPYRLAIDLPRSPLPGQSARGTITLRSAQGPASGTVTLQHTANVTTPDEVHVGRSGAARFTYQTLAGGPVHLDATARVAPTTLRASRPAAGEQLMLTWSAPATVQANATYEASGPGISYHYACTSQCDGHPVVTLTACAPANGYPSRITFWLGDQVRRVTFTAATTRTCRSIQVPLADGVRVSATWRYETPRGWTRPFPAAGAFVVDCPAPPPVAITVDFNCTSAGVAVVLGRERNGMLSPLRNRTRHRMVLAVGGAVSGRYVLAPGQTATVHTFRLPCGSGAAVTIRSGAQRSNGTYNYSGPLVVTMP